jgi:hypothetical protein
MGKILNNTYQRDIVNVVGGQSLNYIFKNTQPNVCFVRNLGLVDVYVGMDIIPVSNNYDDIIPAHAKQSVARPVPMVSLGIYCEQNVTLILEYYAVEDMRPADIPETQPVLFSNVAPINLGNISSITDPLPAGTNTIGKVSISSALPTGNNNIGKVSIEGGLPGGVNNLGRIDINSMPLITNVAGKFTISANGSVTVKAVPGKVIAISTALTDLLVKDGSTEVWKGNISLSSDGFSCSTNITLSSVTGGVVYIVYR